MRGRRRARASDLMIRSRPPRWDTILIELHPIPASLGPAGLQGTELARISQRVMRTSSSDPCRFRRTKRYGKSSRSSAETSSLRLDVGGPDHLAPFLGFLGDQLAELDGRSRQRRAAEVSETGLHLRVVESRVDLLVE